MTKVSAHYLYRKRGIYYLQKRIPKLLIPKYGRSILQRSLRTSNRGDAVRLSSSIVAALEREWQELLFALPQDGSSVYEGLITAPKQEPSLSQAMHIYVQATGKDDNRRFIASTKRSVTEVVSLSGDKAISAYSRSDALKFRDALVSRGSSQATVKRNLSNVRAIWNYIAREHGIETVNPFANMNYGNAKAPVRRMPIPIEDIYNVQKLCFQLDDDIRWIIAAISDSGMRLAEVIGLTANDVHLDGEVPFVRLLEHPWRRLKTAESERDVPLVGATLWGLTRAVEASDDGLLFPRYCSPDGNKANYASSALNKWLRLYVPDGCVVHSFRHSMRDRLRAVQCPSDIIDQIGGWQTAGVGQSYGRGYELDILHTWLKKAVSDHTKLA
jgi:integrase